MQVKFIHAADIHLDSPLRGLEKYEGAPVEYVRGATRKAFVNLVDLAIQEKVDFVLISGDLYDGDWRDYNTGLFFASQMSRLHEAEIRVFLVRGNHDAASQITKSLRLPDNVCNLSIVLPQTVLLDDIGIAVHGKGFSTREVTDDLSISYPNPSDGYFNIGLLHTCVDGREGHDPYAPCRLSYLISKGYDYWALGHVHKREELHNQSPWIIFPGNIQGRHANETGGKGCSLVTLSDGCVDTVQHFDLDVLRWSVYKLDASDLASPDEIMDRAREVTESEVDKAEGRLLALRFIIIGASTAHEKLRNDQEGWINNLRAAVNYASNGEAWVEKVQLKTTRKQEIMELFEDHHPVKFLLDFMKEPRKNRKLLEELSDELSDLITALPPQFPLINHGLDLEDQKAVEEILDDVEELVINRLMSKDVIA